MDWKNVVATFGYHKGKTMFWIYTNDFEYLFNTLKGCEDREISAAATAAVEHKDRVDPYSWM